MVTYSFLAQEAPTSTGIPPSLIPTMVFGIVAITIASAVYYFLRVREKSAVTFVRLAALITVAVLAVLLAMSNTDTEAKTAAFTLMGTIAGYLAGARPAEKTTTVTPLDGEPTKVETAPA